MVCPNYEVSAKQVSLNCFVKRIITKINFPGGAIALLSGEKFYLLFAVTRLLVVPVPQQ